MGDYNSDGIKLSFIKDLAKGDLLDLLKRCDGTKAIFWDPKLKGPFNLIIDWAVLKQHGVKKMFELQEYIPSEVIENKWQSVILLIRPNLPMIDLINKAIRSVSVSQRDKIDFHIIFVSRKSTMCTQRLEKYNIIGEFKNIMELELDLIPFDLDLLTLEYPLGFKEMCTELDDSCLFQVSRSLMSLQSYFGFFPNIIGIGPSAAKVNTMIQRMRKEGAAYEKPLTPRIETLVLIDRRVDLVTPLSTQLTYEGLIDELFGIKNNEAKFPGKAFLSDEEKAQQDEVKPKGITLTSNDTIYNVARDLNFNALGPFLGKKAKQISAAYNEKNDAKSLQQLKQFVSKLPHMQAERKSLEIQTTIAGLVKSRINNIEFRHTLGIEQSLREGLEVDRVNEDIEEMIYKQEPLKKVLRLLCIQCIAADGLKPKILESYKREVIHSYGYHHLITFDRLEKCGLLYMQEKTPKKSYPILRSTLNLVVNNVNEREPNDIAYVHSGYAPLTVRLVSWMTQSLKGLKYVADMVKHLPGPAFQDSQKLSTTQDRLEHSDNHTLVYFLGGCTYAEVSALRFLAQHHPNNATFTIATTKIINGNSLLDTLIEPSSKDKT